MMHIFLRGGGEWGLWCLIPVSTIFQLYRFTFW